MYKEMKKIVEVGNGDEFPDFVDLFFFIGNAHIFFLSNRDKSAD
jgi:hypothetical protein